MLIIDLDGFRRVNDELGHAAGDGLLATVARQIDASVRAEDFVARLGGDEFAVVLGRVSEQSMAVVEDKLRRAIEGMRWESPGPSIAVRASIGARCSNRAVISTR